MPDQVILGEKIYAQMYSVIYNTVSKQSSGNVKIPKHLSFLCSRGSHENNNAKRICKGFNCECDCHC